MDSAKITAVVVPALVTVCNISVPMLPVASSGRRCRLAVIVCVLTPVITETGALSVATSELAPFSNPVPIDTPLSMNVTVPVGVPAPGLKALTVAVKVTLCPNTEAFVEEATVVVVLALVTVWSMLPLLPVKFVSQV